MDRHETRDTGHETRDDLFRACLVSRVSCLVLLAVSAAGCETPSWFRKHEPDPIESVVFRDGKVVPADPASMRSTPELAAAHELYRDAKYGKAESAFHKIAENTKNPPPVAEEARFYEAECLYQQDKYPKACDTYHKVLIDFPAGANRDRAVRRMFDIANYWLDDTRAEMTAYREKVQGERWMVIPAVFHTEKKKPLLDEEGRALQALEQVHLNDMSGPLADKSLFLAGGVKFYRQDYKEADHYFSQLVQFHPNSPLAPEAVRLAIISKHMSTGGPEYDGRKVAEARLMVDTALRTYPELAQKESGFLEKQLGSITLQQAQKDFNTAEFYRRTGHPGSAFFYYEIVRRRYPGTKAAELAAERMEEVREAAERELPRQKNVFEKAQESWDRLWGKEPKPADGPPDSESKPSSESQTPLPADMLPRGEGPR
jgi:outer membrane protein assembly factor BamD (BamD/ComL family)